MWCVVHVRDRDVKDIEIFVAEMLPPNVNARCFHLIRNRRMKYQGQWHIVQEDLFPGYVFIDTDEPDRVYRELKKTPRPKLLFSDDDYVSRLERHESDLMERLTDRRGVIGISKIHIKNDGTIRYLSGPLSRVGFMVKRVNLHKRIAEIEAEFMGRKRVLYLGIDIEGDDRRKGPGRQGSM